MDANEVMAEIATVELEKIQSCNVLFASPGVVRSIRDALNSGAVKRQAALFALEYAPRSIIIEVFSELFELSLETNDQVGLAHERIFQMDRKFLDVEFPKLVEKLLARPDLTWEEYRRVCTLLDRFGYSELIRKVVRQASESDDPDILEVVEDYGDR